MKSTKTNMHPTFRRIATSVISCVVALLGLGQDYVHGIEIDDMGRTSVQYTNGSFSIDSSAAILTSPSGVLFKDQFPSYGGYFETQVYRDSAGKIDRSYFLFDTLINNSRHYLDVTGHTLDSNYFFKGGLKQSGLSIHGQPHGIWKYFRQNGTLYCMGTWDADNLITEFEHSYQVEDPDTGDIIEVSNWSPQHSCPNGLWMMYDQRGVFSHQVRVTNSELFMFDLIPRMYRNSR